MELSLQSVYFRFFRAKVGLTDGELQYFTEPDFVRHVALVATRQDGGGEHIVGLGHYMGLEDPNAPCSRAEVAFAVADAYQGRGVGTLLLDHLAVIARAQGIEEFVADVLGENNRMLQVFETSGFQVQRSIEAGVFHLSFPTAETAQVQVAEARRERLAEAQSVRAFLHPRAVAVVGASRRPGTIGSTLLTNLQRQGFTGAIYPINPHVAVLDGLPTFPQVSTVGAPSLAPDDTAPLGMLDNLGDEEGPPGVQAWAAARSSGHGITEHLAAGAPVGAQPLGAAQDRRLQGARTPVLDEAPEQRQGTMRAHRAREPQTRAHPQRPGHLDHPTVLLDAYRIRLPLPEVMGRLDQRRLESPTVAPRPGHPCGARPLLQAQGPDDRWQWTAMCEQCHHERDGVGGRAQTVQGGACRGGARRVALATEPALIHTRMDAEMALADLASGRARPIGADYGRGVHEGSPPLALPGSMPRRSRSGPPFWLPVPFTTL